MAYGQCLWRSEVRPHIIFATLTLARVFPNAEQQHLACKVQAATLAGVLHSLCKPTQPCYDICLR